MRNFRDLIIWNDSKALVVEIYKFTSTLPKSENFGLVSQINRCSISIPANIAEGCAKNSDKDFKRFLQISLGSLYELESHLIICKDLNYINQEKSKKLINTVQVIQKKIASFINKL